MRHFDIRFKGLTQYANLKIPFFQRSYVWEHDNWEDLLNSISVDSSAGYLGTIILKRESESNDTYIIDGQQRLTTLFILVRALHDYILGLKKEDEDKWSEKYWTVKDIFTDIVFSSKQSIRIEHSEKDKEDFHKIIGTIKSTRDKNGNRIDEVSELSNSENEDGKGKSLIEQCYDYFKTELPKCDDAKLSNIVDFLNKNGDEYFQYFHVIMLGESEEEQIIFDSINNTGKGLTATDTIKNRIFHKLGNFVQNDEELKKIYEDTWKKAFDCDSEDEWFWSEEQKVGTNKRTRSEILLHIYAVIKQFYDPEKHNLKELPKLYRTYLETNNKDEIINILNEIKAYAGIYKDLFDYGENELHWEDYQKRLAFIFDKTNISTLTPYLLYLVKEERDKSDFENLEKLVIRNLIASRSNKDYNKLCPRFIQNNDMVIEEANKVKNGDISLGIRNMKTNNYATAILFCIELYIRQGKDVKGVSAKDLSLEHIMPQNWENWKNVPVYDVDGTQQTDNTRAEIIREKAIYSIGNMTILLKRINSKAKNNPFKEKLEVYENASRLMITEDVKELESWDEMNIYERERELGKTIIDIWGKPNEEEDVKEDSSNNNCSFYKHIRNGVDAVLKHEKDMGLYTVVRGSKIREDNDNPSAKSAIKSRKEKKAAIQENYILSEDCSFKTSSPAASFVQCGSESGTEYWEEISEEEYNKWIDEHQKKLQL